MSNPPQDFRYGLRTLRRTPASLLANGDPLTTSYLDFRDNLRLLQSVTAQMLTIFSLGDGPRTERVWGDMAAGNFFDMPGLKPEPGLFVAGREKDDAQNTHAVVLISHTYWKTHYGSARSAIGATLRINRTPFSIIDVTPQDFHGTHSGLDSQIWMPLTMYGQLTHTGAWMLSDRSTRNFMLLALGSACGLLLATWLGGALEWLLPSFAGPAVLHPPLDAEVFAFTAALTFAVAILDGFVSALHALRSNISEMVKEGGRSAASGGVHSQRGAGAIRFFHCRLYRTADRRFLPPLAGEGRADGASRPSKPFSRTC